MCNHKPLHQYQIFDNHKLLPPVRGGLAFAPQMTEGFPCIINEKMMTDKIIVLLTQAG